MGERWLALGLPGDEETRYRRFSWPGDVNQATVGIGLLCLVTLAYLYNDYLFFGLSPVFFALLALRSLVIGGGLLLLWRLRTGRQDHRRGDVLILLWSLLGIAVLLLIGLSRPVHYYGAAVINVLVVFAAYLLLPLRLVYQALLALFFSLAEIGILLTFRFPYDPMTAYAVVTGYLVANGMGFVFSSRLQAARRREFRTAEKGAAVREELQRLAFHDELTGVANRRAFLRQAEGELARFRRYRKPFSFVMLDLDHFKAVNDRFGHLAGDQVLQGVVATVLSQIRGVDLFGRLGGEEFGLLLPETDETEAREVAERIRRTLAATPLRLASGETVVVTASLGVSTVRSGDARLDELLSRADTALFGAKEGGRDRIHVDPPEVPAAGTP